MTICAMSWLGGRGANEWILQVLNNQINPPGFTRGVRAALFMASLVQHHAPRRENVYSHPRHHAMDQKLANTSRTSG